MGKSTGPDPVWKWEQNRVATASCLARLKEVVFCMQQFQKIILMADSPIEAVETHGWPNGGTCAIRSA
jgi:hypothetical protein